MEELDVLRKAVGDRYAIIVQLKVSCDVFSFLFQKMKIKLKQAKTKEFVAKMKEDNAVLLETTEKTYKTKLEVVNNINIHSLFTEY